MTTTALESPIIHVNEQEKSDLAAISEFLIRRPRRTRRTQAIRDLVQEAHLLPTDFIVPLFIKGGVREKEPIKSMPGIFRFSIDEVLKEIEKIAKLGIPAINLFTMIPEEHKDSSGSKSKDPQGVLQCAIRAIKKEFPQMCVMADIALDPFTLEGHDGVVENGEIDNDLSLVALGRMALSIAEAGIDWISPSDMMDGRIAYLRRILDARGFHHVGILAYSAKYASAIYGPFRDALQSTPKKGDKKSYQLNPGNVREALIEARLDEEEGADLLLVKPGLPYLDVLTKVKQQTNLPVGVYHVSGEYAMVKAAAERGWIDGNQVMLEQLLAFKRAGADFIFSYAAQEVLMNSR